MTCTFCPHRCFLPENRAVVALPLTDRGDEPVDQHRRLLAAFLLPGHVTGGDSPQDRMQDLVVAGDRGLRTAEHLGHHII
ncbi:hypothetical protein GCM10010201_21770 [Pilimelia columellifera subsp. columellifera]|uniref:Uncharacterized protein n=1 Tax=Pilimelia columellifera subsp. columellifera TaxID=706583 RepID=A0ABP6AU73_9ACTN